MPWLKKLSRGLRSLLRRSQSERELDDELRFHLDRLVAEKVEGGMSLQEARRRARLELGGVEQVKERVREVRWGTMFESIFQDIRYGVRTLRMSPGFTVVAVLTLALGIGVNTAIFSVVEGVLWRPLPYKDADRLVFLWNHWTASDTKTVMAPGDLADFREQATLFEGFAAAIAFDRPLTGEGEPAQIPFGQVTSNYFRFLGVTPLLGRGFTSENEPDNVVISYRFWSNRLGGDPNIIGGTITIREQVYTIIGVLPLDFKVVMPQKAGIPREVSVWTQIAPRWFGPEGRDRQAHWLRTVGRLKPGVTLAQAQAEMDALAERVRAVVPSRAKRKAEIIVAPLRDEVVKPVRTEILLLWVGVGFVLMIACANVANLQFARSQHRTREIGIRMSLGAGRIQVLRQILTESVLLAFLGGVFGAVLGWEGIHLLSLIQPKDLPRFDNVEFNGIVLGFSFLIALLTVVLSGMAPALRLAGTDVNGVLASGGRTSTTQRRFWSRHLLTVGEVAISLVLLVGTGLMVRTMVHLAQTDPGFQTDRILTFQATRPRDVKSEEFHRILEERLRRIPGVQSVGSIFHTPLDGRGESSEYTIDEGLGDEFNHRAASRLVTGDLFETLGIPLIAGRYFTWDDGGDVVIVDEKLARRIWGEDDPLGKRLKVSWWSGPVWARVVGVVPSLHSEYLYQEDRELLYRVAFPYMYADQTFVVQSRGDMNILPRSIRQEVQKIYPDVPLTKVRTLASYRTGQMAPTRFVLTLLGIFAGIGLVLAVVGLYGVVSYGVNQRTHEFGIRIALGARTLDVLSLVFREGLTLILIGLGIGVASALGLVRFLSSLLYGVKPGDWLTFGSVSALLFGIALLACYVPARRATKVDPMVALRYE